MTFVRHIYKAIKCEASPLPSAPSSTQPFKGGSVSYPQLAVHMLQLNAKPLVDLQCQVGMVS